MQIRQRQLRRRKNVSFKGLSVVEQEKARQQPPSGVTHRTLGLVEELHGIKFSELIPQLRRIFPGETIEILDEGSGRSSLKIQLEPEFPRQIKITRSDMRPDVSPDGVCNVLDLVKTFGKSRFHFVISTYGGSYFSPIPEKAFFQIVSVLKPKGIGLIITPLPKEEIYKLAKRFNVTIQRFELLFPGPARSIIFTKNLSGKKPR